MESAADRKAAPLVDLSGALTRDVARELLERRVAGDLDRGSLRCERAAQRLARERGFRRLVGELEPPAALRSEIVAGRGVDAHDPARSGEGKAAIVEPDRG